MSHWSQSFKSSLECLLICIPKLLDTVTLLGCICVFFLQSEQLQSHICNFFLLDDGEDDDDDDDGDENC